MNHKIFLFVLILLSITSQVCLSQTPENQEDRTLAPYFVVLTDDPTIDQLPLQSTSAEVNIAGVIVNVKVTQVYKNNGTRPIEAIYVFPLSTNAAVYQMRMILGDVMLEAQIKEREEARQEYEDAKDQGKTATLLEENRPNVFQMNVANILPGDLIEVQLNYVELLVPEDGVYEFTYPAVVGPRYSEKKTSEVDQSEYWVETPYQHEGEDALYDFDVHVHINSAVPLQSIDSPSHDIQVTQENALSADIALTTTERAGLKDYHLRYNLRGDEIVSGAMLYKGEDENFFLVMIEPPARIDESIIPPREYIFVQDISGSMHGFPLDVSKQFFKKLLQDLRPTDVFNIITFSGGSNILFESSQPAVPENIDYALQMVDQLYGGGGTRLLSALQRAFGLPLYSDNLARTTMVMTDGYINAEYEVFDYIRAHLSTSNVFAAGIGSSPNRFLIDGMAHVGEGEPMYVSNPNDIDETITRYSNYIKEPLLTHINVESDGFEAYDVEPPTVPDVFAQRPIIIIGKYIGEPTGKIILAGKTAQGDYRQEIQLSPELEKDENSALRYLWARKRIQLKSDYQDLLYNTDPDLKNEITQLGLQYNLLTRYTSFIAVYQEIRNVSGEIEVVEQPLPLPEGVEDPALPGNVGVEDWMLMENLRSGEMPTVENKEINEPIHKALVTEVLDYNMLKVEINGKTIILVIPDMQPLIKDVNHRKVMEYLKQALLGKYITLEDIQECEERLGNETCIQATIKLDGVNILDDLIQKISNYSTK